MSTLDKLIKGGPPPKGGISWLGKPKGAGLMTEREAAQWLGTTPFTLARERKKGGIGYVAFGKAGVRYTHNQLQEYIKNRSVNPCQTSMPESEAIGSASAPAPINGKSPISTPKLDKHAAFQLAKATFNKPNSH